MLQLPRSNPPNGPGQVANQFLSEQVVADALFPFRQNRAEVTFGNLLTVPAGQGLLYVQPVFVRAQGGESFPTLQRVLVSYGNEVAANTTLARSLADLFGDRDPGSDADHGPDRPDADRQPRVRRRWSGDVASLIGRGRQRLRGRPGRPARGRLRRLRCRRRPAAAPRCSGSRLPAGSARRRRAPGRRPRATAAPARAGVL